MERYRKRRLNPRFVILSAVLAALTLAVIAAGISKLLGGGALPAEETPVPAYVEKDYLTVNEWSRPGEALKKIKGVVIHYVGNPGTTAQANRNYFESLSSGSTATYASSHFIIGLEGEVIQCVPLTEIAYASNSRNGDTVSIEVCHPDETGAFTEESREALVALVQWLCDAYGLGRDQVIRHYDVTGKDCPLYYVDHPDEWEQFLDDLGFVP